jgi:peptidylprolyl isomerase
MEKVENGHFVNVHYTGTLDDGDVFDSSVERNVPLEVEIGKGQLIKGFEDELMGMAVNEKKTFTLKPEEAYGDYDENLTRSFPRKSLPPEMNPEVDQTVAMQTEDGCTVPAQIIAVDDENITIDLNHPLAGTSLTFEIEVVGISDSPQQKPDCGPACDCSSGCAC